MGIITACFNLEGKDPLSTEMFMRVARGLVIICRAHFNRRVGQDHSPCDLLDGVLINSNSISVDRTGSKTNEPLKLIFGKYCVNSLLLLGMLDASLGPSEAKWPFKIFA